MKTIASNIAWRETMRAEKLIICTAIKSENTRDVVFLRSQEMLEVQQNFW